MAQETTITPYMAHILISAIGEDIRAYIDSHKEEFEAFQKKDDVKGAEPC